MSRLHSSKQHRNAERTNATAEIASSALKSIAPVAMIPAKLAQALNSGYCLFKPEIKPHEKAIHAFKTAMSIAQVTILVVMLFKEEQCQTIKPNICKILLMFELLYQGSLLVSWVPSELYKEEMVSVATETAPAILTETDAITPTMSTEM